MPGESRRARARFRARVSARSRARLSLGIANLTVVAVDLLAQAEQSRIAALLSLDATTQDTLGQFFTPARAAVLIAAMPRLPFPAHGFHKPSSSRIIHFFSDNFLGSFTRRHPTTPAQPVKNMTIAVSVILIGMGPPTAHIMAPIAANSMSARVTPITPTIAYRVEFSVDSEGTSRTPLGTPLILPSTSAFHSALV